MAGYAACLVKEAFSRQNLGVADVSPSRNREISGIENHEIDDFLVRLDVPEFGAVAIRCVEAADLPRSALAGPAGAEGLEMPMSPEKAPEA